MQMDEEKVKGMVKEPAVNLEYDARAEGIALVAELFRARRRAGLTQAEVAVRMGSEPCVVSYMEAVGGRRRRAPSVAMLRRYARAVGCRLELRLRPAEKPSTEA
jgi:transcriptional regulator with XRE-family HTH domain